MVHYHDRGFFGTVFRTLFGNFFIWLSGIPIISAVFKFIQITFATSIYPNLEDKAAQAKFASDYGIWLLWIILGLTIVGVLWGMAERGTRKKAIEIEKANEYFLTEHGIEETGGSDSTHIDSENNSLRISATARRAGGLVKAPRGGLLPHERV